MPLDKRSALKLLGLLGITCSLTRCALAPVGSPQISGAPVSSEPVSSEPVLNKPNAMAQPTLTIQPWPDHDAPRAHVHAVTIPPDYPIEVAISEQLQTVAEFAMETEAMAVLNGGFFDPNNAQTTSFVTVNGQLVADPRHNQRLMDNPDLASYQEQILNRSEFRRYGCGDDIRYDITVHTASLPDGCTLHSSLGAGPQLFPDTSHVEGFTDYAVDGSLIRDAIGTQQRNARSAIGIRPDGTVVWAMVAQAESASGVTLGELTELMATLGAEKALNLDGGSSSSLYAAWSDTTRDDLAQTYYGRVDQTGQTIQRSVKSVLWLPSLGTRRAIRGD